MARRQQEGKRGSRRGGGRGSTPGSRSGHRDDSGGLNTDSPRARSVTVRAKKLLLHDDCKKHILDLIHQLREQERDDDISPDGCTETRIKAPRRDRSSGMPRGSQTELMLKGGCDSSLEVLEQALMEAGVGDGDAPSSEEEDLGESRVFAAMANMMARTKLSAVADDDSSEEGSESHSEDSLDEDEESSGSEDEGRAIQTSLSRQEQEVLLKRLIKSAREEYVANEVEAATNAEHDCALKSRNRTLSKKVRLTLCNENGGRKVVVLERRKDLKGLFDAAKNKLKIKKPMHAILQSGENLGNTLLVGDGAVVVVKGKEGKGLPPRALPPVPAQKMDEQKRLEARESAERKEIEKVKETMASLAAVKKAYLKRNELDLNSEEGRGKLTESRERAFESLRLAELLQKKEGSSKHKGSFFEQRASLPAFSQREAILEAVAAHQVVVVEGETGSGKTTQLPQFILDDWSARGKGGECNIVCTQPRRISAIGVAERVAEERLEKVGETVGYSVRFNTRRSPQTRLLFCTTGVLLRRLAYDKDLAGVSHVLVDEVHERTLESDFLLIVLKDLLACRPELKVVLMSATLQASLFSSYFDNSPCLHIPGRAFQVSQLYLDDVEELVAGRRGPGRPRAAPRASRAGSHFARGRTDRGGMARESSEPCDGEPLYHSHTARNSTGKGEETEDGQDGDETLKEDFGAEGARQLRMSFSTPSDRVAIDYELIAKLTRRLVEDFGDKNEEDGGGAVLIFLPGLSEIERSIRTMKQDALLSDKKRACIFALHSSMPTEAQRAIFRKMEAGVCKIVVATNIAETSITVTDVTHVIDTGREKQTGYDPYTHMTSLREVWTSQASAKQRAGRAGRVRPGICYRLYTESFMQDNMAPHAPPEIRRVLLENLILTILLLELGPPEAFLQRAVEPPSPKAVKASLQVLLDIEAVALGPPLPNGSRAIVLNPLGFHLASLPVDCRLGKMLVFASLFACVDPILTIAAAFSSRSPFVAPIGKREEAQLAKQRFAEDKSDHLALVALWKAWKRVKDGDTTARKAFAKANFVSIAALEEIDATRSKLYDDLVKCGFAPCATAESLSATKSLQAIDYDSNENDKRLLRCILLCGLTPQIAKLVRPTRGRGAHFITKDPTLDVAIHPSSVNAKRISQAGSDGNEALAVYHRKMRTSRTYLHDISFVSPLSVLLFGSNIRTRREHGGIASKVVNITVDDWLSFKTKEETSVLVTVFKKHLDACLTQKITQPDSNFISRFQPVVRTLRRVLWLEAV